MSKICSRPYRLPGPSVRAILHCTWLRLPFFRFFESNDDRIQGDKASEHVGDQAAYSAKIRLEEEPSLISSEPILPPTRHLYKQRTSRTSCARTEHSSLLH